MCVNGNLKNIYLTMVLSLVSISIARSVTELYHTSSVRLSEAVARRPTYLYFVDICLRRSYLPIILPNISNTFKVV